MIYGKLGKTDASLKISMQELKDVFSIVRQIFKIPRKQRYKWLMEKYGKEPESE